MFSWDRSIFLIVKVRLKKLGSICLGGDFLPQSPASMAVGEALQPSAARAFWQSHSQQGVHCLQSVFSAPGPTHHTGVPCPVLDEYSVAWGGRGGGGGGGSTWRGRVILLN